MLQIYSTVHENTLKTINSSAYITKTYHEGKPLPIGTIDFKRNFTHVHFFDKLEPLRIGPYKFLDRLSDITYELLAQDGSTLHVHRTYPKEPLLYPHLRSFMRFSDSTQFNIARPNKYANSDSSPFNSDESMSNKGLSSQFTTPSTNSNHEPTSSSSNDHSSIKLYDNSFFKEIITSPQTDICLDISRHQSKNQSRSLPPLIDRTTKTHYHQRHQPN